MVPVLTASLTSLELASFLLVPKLSNSSTSLEQSTSDVNKEFSASDIPLMQFPRSIPTTGMTYWGSKGQEKRDQVRKVRQTIDKCIVYSHPIILTPPRFWLDDDKKSKCRNGKNVQEHGIEDHPKLPLDVILGPGRSFKGRQEDHQKTVSHHQPPQIDTAGENRIQDKCQDGKLNKGPDRTDYDGAFDIQTQKK